MTEPTTPDVAELLTKVRVRKCPGCGEPLEWFDLTALLLPIEQATINDLKQLNRTASWSVRTWGEASISELQFLAFAAICPSCTLISHWDFHTDELEAVLQLGAQSPTRLKWNHSIPKIQHLVNVAPDNRKEAFQRLLDAITPKVPPTK